MQAWRVWLAVLVTCFHTARPEPAAGQLVHSQRQPSASRATDEHGVAHVEGRRVAMRGAGRSLQQAAEAVNPTLDEVDTVIFARPPYNTQTTTMMMYYLLAGIYLACAIVVLVGANLDQTERQRRNARAIVPQESVPCGIAEQYYLDPRLLALRTAEDCMERKQGMSFFSYLFAYGSTYFQVLAREHLVLSFMLTPIPTFSRVKRAVLVILELHLCMLVAGMAYNIREHEAPRGKYEMLSCSGGFVTASCTATLPMALISAAALCPVFRFGFHRQMRLTCLTSQVHPTTSRFPLGVRKFARIPPKSFRESFLCMRNIYERMQARANAGRTLIHRGVHTLWRTTRSSIKDLRFHGVMMSWAVVFLYVVIVGATLAYMILFTAYLKEAIVFHWLSWTLTMFFTSVLVLEPLLIFWTDVVWCAIIAALAQNWGLGAHALAATTKYKDVVRQVEQLFVKPMRGVGATRIQRWWLAVLDMYRAIHEQTAAAIRIQAIRKKMIHQKKYIKERKWCMRCDVIDVVGLEEVQLGSLMSPVLRLQCDEGNPAVMQTKVAWDAGEDAKFNETFWVDIKESSAMYLSAWSKGLTTEEFIGRGYFEFNQLKTADKDRPQGVNVKLELRNIQHGEKHAQQKVCGAVNVRVSFLDPLKEACGDDALEENAWMLPKHRMQFALSKMGGKPKLGKMLGHLPPSANQSNGFVDDGGAAAPVPFHFKSNAQAAGGAAASSSGAGPSGNRPAAGPPSGPPGGPPPAGQAPPRGNAPAGPAPNAAPKAAAGPQSRPPVGMSLNQGSGPPGGNAPRGNAPPGRAPAPPVPGAVSDEDGV